MTYNLQSSTPKVGEKIFDLEERSFQFAKAVALFCRTLPKTESNLEYIRQLIRASGSIGANYIEAIEALGKKDATMRLRICRKEAKESAYWLRLIVETNADQFSQPGRALYQEAVELKNILSAMLNKSR